MEGGGGCRQPSRHSAPRPRCSAAVADRQPVKEKKKGHFAGEGGVASCGSPFAPVNGKAGVDHLDHRAVRQ